MGMKTNVLPLFLALAACGNGLVGSRYVKSQTISASQGGALTVAATDDSELAGASLTIGPGALAADTVVTVERGLDDLGPGRAGPVLILGPSGLTLSKEAEVVLPVKLGSGQSKSDLSVKCDDDRLSGGSLAYDDSTGRVRLRTTKLGAFQASAAAVGSNGNVVACVTDDVCADEQDCIAGACTWKHSNPGGACVTDDTCADNEDCVGGQCVAKK